MTASSTTSDPIRYRKQDFSQEKQIAEAGVRVSVPFGAGNHSTLHGQVVGYVPQTITSLDDGGFGVEPLVYVAVKSSDVVRALRDYPEELKPKLKNLIGDAFGRGFMTKQKKDSVWTRPQTSPEEWLLLHRVGDLTIMADQR